MHLYQSDSAHVLAFAAAVLIGADVAASQTERRAVSLWRDPGNIAALDLFWGCGAPERAPRGPFVFLEEDASGTQPKMHVRDAAGQHWDVKFGEEVHAEIASNRLLWALGYVAEEAYFVAAGSVTSVPRKGRIRHHVGADGAFQQARFRLRRLPSARVDRRWSFEQNPFIGSKELSGLMILMTLLNNWDIQGARNNRILRVNGEDRYIVSDLGATFGQMGAFLAPHSKWNLEDFRKEQFIEGVKDGLVDLDYEGSASINKVPLNHARWFATLVSQLTDTQLEAALRSSGATERDVAGFSSRLREKIVELQRAVGPAEAIH